MNANQADFPVRTMCQVLGVSHSRFHDWRHRAPSARVMDDMVLIERIRQVHAESGETYGRPRIWAELAAQGVRVSGKRIACLMRQVGLQGISKRWATTVTIRRDPRERPAADRVKRHFRAERANQLWVADMTYVPTWAGFIYLAVVMDVFSRRILDSSMGERMTVQLVLAALNVALTQRKSQDFIHHSDQESQYTSLVFGQRCAEMGLRPSRGSVGDAYDNAMAEGFFATLEYELTERRNFRSEAEAKAAVFSYIEGWYNHADATPRWATTYPWSSSAASRRQVTQCD